MNPLEKAKHTSFIYIPERRQQPEERAETDGCDDIPMPKWKCFDIPSPSAKPGKCPVPPQLPKPTCSIVVTPPTISCPPIEMPPSCPIQITVQQEIPAGSCRRYDTVERESNTVSKKVEGKTIVLCSEGFEKRSKYVTRKDNHGMSHTYCREFETRSNLAKGCTNPIQTSCPVTKPISCGTTHKHMEGNTNFRNAE